MPDSLAINSTSRYMLACLHVLGKRHNNSITNVISCALVTSKLLESLIRFSRSLCQIARETPHDIQGREEGSNSLKEPLAVQVMACNS